MKPRTHFSARLIGVALSFATLLPLASDAQRGRGGNPFQPPNAVPQFARTRSYDMRHLQLVFDINAADRSAKGVVTLTLTPLRMGLETIILDAGTNLQIESCRVNGQTRTFQRKGDQLLISNGAVLPLSKEAVIEIRYAMPGGVRLRGANDLGGFHWIEPSAAEGGFSRPARPKEGEPLPLTIGFWTQGETEGNRTWVPCYDYPNDFYTSEITVTGPDNWVIIGNGAEGKMTQDRARRTKTYRWKMTQPHASYLLSLAGGELDVKKDSWEGVPLYYVVPKGKADLIPGSFEDTPRMLSFFSGVLGVKYAWPKYAQNAMYDFGGGMENVSATTLGAMSLTDKRSGYYPMASLNSHELAHQWFGDLVTCESWGDVWLNESFASYFEQLYMEHSRGKDTFDLDREDGRNAYLSEAQRYKRPLSTRLYRDPDVMFDSHTYPKGACILHMLRRQLGDTAFYKGLNHYLTVNRHKPVNAYDLSKAITEATGFNAEPFFAQWVLKPGHPVLEMKWSYDEATKEAVVTVKQAQDTSDGTPIYNTPLTLGLLRRSSGDPVERQTVTLDKAEQTFRLPAATKPEALLLDPDRDLLKQTQNITWTESELPVILRSAPNVVDRRAAARRIAEGDLTEAKITTLSDALKSEPSEEAAETFINLLSPAKSEALRGLFREQAKSAQYRRRAAALNALAKLPSTPEEVALLRDAAKSDKDYYAVVEAGLNGLDVASNLEVFRHQVNSRSMNDRLAKRAVARLKSANLDAAASAILDALKPERTTSLRMEAIRALGEIALKDATVRTALLGLLKDSKAAVQEAAIRTLRDRKEKEAIPALRALAAETQNETIKSAAQDALREMEGQ